MDATAPSNIETAQSDDEHIKPVQKEKRLSLLEQRGREAVPLACTCVVLSYLDISGILSLGAASVRSRRVARSDAVCHLKSSLLRFTLVLTQVWPGGFLELVNRQNSKLGGRLRTASATASKMRLELATIDEEMNSLASLISDDLRTITSRRRELRQQYAGNDLRMRRSLLSRRGAFELYSPRALAPPQRNFDVYFDVIAKTDIATRERSLQVNVQAHKDLKNAHDVLQTELDHQTTLRDILARACHVLARLGQHLARRPRRRHREVCALHYHTSSAHS